jgi:hypothetical protein
MNNSVLCAEPSPSVVFLSLLGRFSGCFGMPLRIFPALALFAAQVLLPNALQSQCSPIPPIQSQVCMPSHLGGGPPICIAQPDRDGDGIPDAIEAKLIAFHHRERQRV